MFIEHAQGKRLPGRPICGQCIKAAVKETGVDDLDSLILFRLGSSGAVLRTEQCNLAFH